MKLIKMFGLAVMAALMAMAFAGAGSAMAEPTALCNTMPGTGAHEKCAAGHLVTHVHEETLSGNLARVLSSIFDISCDVLFLGDTLGNGLADPGPLVIHGTFTYFNCDNNCTVTEENGPSEFKVLKEGHELATEVGESLQHLVCGFFINCRYNGVGLEAHVIGPLLTSETNGDFTIRSQSLSKEGSGVCPKVAVLHILMTPLPNPVYITE